MTVSNYTSDTLFAFKPHHYKYLQESDGLLSSDHVYTSARGTLRLMQGLSFGTVYNYTSFVSCFPNVFDTSDITKLNYYFSLISDSFIAGNPAIENPPAAVSAAQGTYATGKYLGRFAQMMPALDIAGQSDLKAEIIGYMRAVLTQWFSPFHELSDVAPPIPSGDYNDSIQGLQSSDNSNVRYFYYDEVWNTLIGYPADFNAGIELNDHHFHYGYFIHSMAYILMYGSTFDQAWVLSHQNIIEMMIKDCANWDRSDSMFPFLKFFNVFNGHFYANGWGFGAGNQESTPEAMNFAAGVLLWGYLTGNDAIKNLGVFLYTHQKITLQEYWFDINSTNFPKNLFYLDTLTNKFGRYNYNRHIVCDLYSAAGDFSTFFGAQAVFIYGIQYLPITHASVYLGLMPQKLARIDADLLTATQNFLNQGVSYDPTQEDTINFSANYKIWDWVDIFAEVRAMYDPQQAVIDLEAMGLYQTELFIPSNYLSDWSVDALPANSLHPAVYPPFSDTPLGEAGDSKVHTYYWVHALNALGPVQPDFVADTEFAVAFGYNLGVPDNFLVYQHTSDAEKISFRNVKSGQKYYFDISGQQKLYWFTLSDRTSDSPLPSDIFYPLEIVGLDYSDSVCVGQTIQISFEVSDSLGGTDLINYHVSGGNVSGLFGQTLSNTAVTFSDQAITSGAVQSYNIFVSRASNDHFFDSVNVRVLNSGQSVNIFGLIHPNIICTGQTMQARFRVSDSLGNSDVINYYINGGNISDLSGQTLSNAVITFSDQALSSGSYQTYTILAVSNSNSSLSSVAGFSVLISDCTQNSDQPSDINPSNSSDQPPLSPSIEICLGNHSSTICVGSTVRAQFMILGRDIGTSDIQYVIYKGGVIEVSDQRDQNTWIAYKSQIQSVATTLNYTIYAYVPGVTNCVANKSFQVIVQNCEGRVVPVANQEMHSAFVSLFLVLFLAANLGVLFLTFFSL